MEPQNKVALTISRYWHEPTIYTIVSGEGIAMAIPLDDYLQALAAELSTNVEPLQRANKLVLAKIKEESAKVV
mgnify:CR=1 FL=1